MFARNILWWTHKYRTENYYQIIRWQITFYVYKDKLNVFIAHTNNKFICTLKMCYLSNVHISHVSMTFISIVNTLRSYRFSRVKPSFLSLFSHPKLKYLTKCDTSRRSQPPHTSHCFTSIVRLRFCSNPVAGTCFFIPLRNLLYYILWNTYFNDFIEKIVYL